MEAAHHMVIQSRMKRSSNAGPILELELCLICGWQPKVASGISQLRISISDKRF